MIVDMERNDLSKICKPGSVKILKKKYVEEYKHLFHYVTSIGGILNKNTKLIDKKKNKIITRPIAGTFKKKLLSNKNIALKYFKNNEKETKEHNMIVDMERSDLSKICKPGSVKILKKKYVEEYKHLFHYVTSIGGILNKNTKLIDIIKAMMPGGSVIGCPKIRTLELLNNQEKESRNIFTGSFGFIKFNQDMKFNIIIRSILNYKNQSEISAASGVVLDSSPKKEFNENYIKAKSLLELFK